MERVVEDDADRRTPGKADTEVNQQPAADTLLEQLERDEIRQLEAAKEAMLNPKRPPTMMSQARRADNSTLQHMLSQPFMPPVMCLERPVPAAKRPAPAPVRSPTKPIVVHADHD